MSKQLTLPRLLIAVTTICLVGYFLVTGWDDPFAVREPAPPEVVRVLRAIAVATREYFVKTGSWPRTLEDLHGMSVSLGGDSTKLLRIADLPLEKMTYTPEFMGRAGVIPILAYVPVEGQKKLAVLYFFPDKVTMRSEEELHAELRSLRGMHQKENGGRESPASQPLRDQTTGMEKRDESNY